MIFVIKCIDLFPWYSTVVIVCYCYCMYSKHKSYNIYYLFLNILQLGYEDLNTPTNEKL